MWKLDRSIRIAGEEIEEIGERRRELDEGHVLDELRVTPRERNERNVFWSELKRVAIRRENRQHIYGKAKNKEEELEKKIQKARRKMQVKSKFPEVHMHLFRRPGEITEELKECLASLPNVKGVYDWRALHVGVIQNQPQIVDLVLSYQECDINAQDAIGYTALHYALMDPERFHIAKRLVKASADLTIRNREGLNPLEVSLSLGFYNHVAHFLESFSIWELAAMQARRFFMDYFTGDANFHHYKNINYELGLLMAYLVVMHPSLFRRKLPRLILIRKFRGKQRTMNNLERFFHSYQGNHIFNKAYDNRFEVGMQKKPARWKVWKWRRRDPEEDDAATNNQQEIEQQQQLQQQMRQDTLALLDQEEEEEELEEELDEINLLPGLFKEFPPNKVRQWKEKSLKWKFDKGHVYSQRISSRAFNGTLSPEQIVQNFEDGRNIFNAWRDKNQHVLIEDEHRRLREVADALRLRRLREERDKKRQERREAAEKERALRAKKGLDRIDFSASVEISESRLLYSVDAGIGSDYSIKLGAKPRSSVLMKFTVQHHDENEEAQFMITPTLITFTPMNWDKEQWIEVQPVDDDAIVRLKRNIAQGEPGCCDHKVVHTIQSTTDLSYKHPDLTWNPAKVLKLLVK